MENIIREFGKESMVLLLGRNRYDLEMVKESGLFSAQKNGKVIYKPSPDTPCSFLTIHQAKGLEADNVILLNFRNETLGFPRKIVDDPLLELVLTDSEDYPYAEERRLLYVALTRTRNRIYILVDETSPSEFMDELKSSDAVVITKDDNDEVAEVTCPVCRSGHLVLRGNKDKQGSFVGCSNYPQCGFMMHDTSVLKKPRICPSCGGFLVRRTGRYGDFYGCINYPYCEYKEKEENPAPNQESEIRLQEYHHIISNAQVQTCPECGGTLILRTAHKGPYAGNQFYGCSNFPTCRYIKKCKVTKGIQ